MRWDQGHQSSNVDDRRGAGGTGGGGRRPGLKLGLGGLVIVGILSLVLGRDLLTPLLGADGGGIAAGPAVAPAGDDTLAQFVSFVLDDTQTTWRAQFTQRGRSYTDARLVLFTSQVSTACGEADSGTGPFYCPADQQAYIDLSFYQELRQRFGAPGDFAQAYVLAHEIGHHVQHLIGTDTWMRGQQAANPARENELSVRLELQADCYAGIWAHSTNQRQLLEAGDVEEAMAAASAIGDDTLQRQARGRVRPDTFTHGTSAQRVQWFRQGLSSGQLESCDTFSGSI
jgi:uncharacterized protein